MSVPYLGFGRMAWQPTGAVFAPLAPGAAENFAFAIGRILGDENVLTVAWHCVLAPYQTIADATPQSHVISASNAALPQIDLWPPPSVGTGSFLVALVGGFTTAEVGAVYVLSATVTTDAGRALTVSADLPIG